MVQRKSVLQFAIRELAVASTYQPNINFNQTPKTFWSARLITQFLCNLNSFEKENNPQLPDGEEKNGFHLSDTKIH